MPYFMQAPSVRFKALTHVPISWVCMGTCPPDLFDVRHTPEGGCIRESMTLQPITFLNQHHPPQSQAIKAHNPDLNEKGVCPLNHRLTHLPVIELAPEKPQPCKHSLDLPARLQPITFQVSLKMPLPLVSHPTSQSRHPRPCERIMMS